MPIPREMLLECAVLIHERKLRTETMGRRMHLSLYPTQADIDVYIFRWLTATTLGELPPLAIWALGREPVLDAMRRQIMEFAKKVHPKEVVAAAVVLPPVVPTAAASATAAHIARVRKYAPRTIAGYESLL